MTFRIMIQHFQSSCEGFSIQIEKMEYDITCIFFKIEVLLKVNTITAKTEVMSSTT